MKARTLVGVIIVGAAASFLLAGSKEVVSVVEPERIENMRQVDAGKLEELTADAVLIARIPSGDVVYEKRSSEVLPIASITKLFLAHIVLSSRQTEDSVSVTWSDLNTEGEAGGLTYGEKYTMRELVFPLLLASSNDAGTVLVRNIGHASYAEALERVLTDASLRDTTIVDGTGLSPQNRSSAKDIAAFLSFLDEQHPHVLDVTALSSYVGEYHSWQNNNPMAGRSSFRGGKNGFTDAAGRTFAGVLTDSRGAKYTVVLLGSNALPGDLERVEEALP